MAFWFKFGFEPQNNLILMFFSPRMLQTQLLYNFFVIKLIWNTHKLLYQPLLKNMHKSNDLRALHINQVVQKLEKN